MWVKNNECRHNNITHTGFYKVKFAALARVQRPENDTKSINSKKEPKTYMQIKDKKCE